MEGLRYLLKIIIKNGKQEMKLSELQKGEHASIIAIRSSEDLKRRLNSFGVVRGSVLTVEAYSLANKTIEIRVDDTLIGLRATEAAEIEVEKKESGEHDGM